MKRILGLVSSLVLTALLVACASTQNYDMAVRSWQGANEKQLNHIWGYPNHVRKMPSGHRLLIYRVVNRGRYPVYSAPGYTSVETSGGTTRVTSVPTTEGGGGSYDYRCTTWFEVNGKKRVVNTSFRGNGCVATDSFLQNRRRP